MTQCERMQTESCFVCIQLPNLGLVQQFPFAEFFDWLSVTDSTKIENLRES